MHNGLESLFRQTESMKTVPTKPEADRRSSQRERCVFRCRITHGPWKEIVDAVIRDLHGDGARLHMNAQCIVTGQVRLEVQPSGAVYTADVVWQRGSALGLRLIATLDQTVERQIEALRRAGAQMRQTASRPTDDDGY